MTERHNKTAATMDTDTISNICIALLLLAMLFPLFWDKPEISSFHGFMQGWAKIC